MYGLTQCGLCRRPRIVETNDSVTTCPYCGHSERAGRNGFIFTSERMNVMVLGKAGRAVRKTEISDLAF